MLTGVEFLAHPGTSVAQTSGLFNQLCSSEIEVSPSESSVSILGRFPNIKCVPGFWRTSLPRRGLGHSNIAGMSVKIVSPHEQHRGRVNHRVMSCPLTSTIGQVLGKQNTRQRT